MIVVIVNFSKLIMICGILGANITLECVAHGEPVPKVSWRKKIGMLPKGRHSITAAGLRLVNISSSDEGVYVCEMNNGVAPVLIHNVEVFLQGMYH